MKSVNGPSSRAERPRLVCRLVRQWCVFFDDRNSQHARSCPDCRAHFAALNLVDCSLRDDAAAASRAFEPVGSRLEQDILRAVRAAAEPAPARQATNRAYGWIGGLGAMAAIAAVVVSLNDNPQRVQRDLQPMAPASEETAVILDTVETLSTQFVDSVIPKAGGLVSSNPLQEELGAVYSDVRSALDFLALNFLPRTPADAESPPARRG